MTPELEPYEGKWSEVPKTSLTRLLYQKKYRVETPEGGEKLVGSMDEVRHFLELYYGEE